MPPPEPAEPAPENIPLNIVFEDDAMIVIDKPRGLVVHPAAGHPTGTLVNALIAHCGDSLSGIGGVRRPGIVHRLDKDTTGLMVVAKTDRAHRALAEQFADHGRSGPLERGYLAFVWGVPDRPKGTIDKPLGRHPHARDKMAVRADGRAGGHPLAGAGALPRGRRQAGRQPARLPAGNRPHPPDPGASGGRSAIRYWATTSTGPGFKTKAAHLAPPGARRPGGPWTAGPACLSIGYRTSGTGESLEFRSELPADLARLRHSLGAQGRSGLKCEKIAPNQQLGVTWQQASRRRDARPSIFRPLSSCMLHLRSMFAIAAMERHRRLRERRCDPARRYSGAN